MSPEDFSQFDDVRVRNVMAAAANLVEAMYSSPCEPEYPELNDLKTALFAAQHSRPKHVEVVLDTCLGGCECPKCGENTYVSLKRCTKCHGDGVSHCVICGVNG